jgi:hypothetical protein
MSEISRREVLRRLALAIATMGAVDRSAAQEVHQMAGMAAASSGGGYVPTALTAHEYTTLERLTDLIIPVENGAPGAVAAGAPAWIDTLLGVNNDLKTSYPKGLAWLDSATQAKGAADFATAPPAQQTAVLDLIAYRRNQSPELDAGIQFFTLARRMTVDAFYTSEIGIRDIGYRGNSPRATFPEPTEAIAYALKKANL